MSRSKARTPSGLVIACAALAACGGASDMHVTRDAGDPTLPATPTCAAAAHPAGAAVQAPQLRATLPASFDENWLASPAIVDVDRDGRPDIVAARHSVLYAWRNDGTPLWHTAFGHSASSTPEHGDSRMWASPVVGDFDGDGRVEIAVGSDADSSLGMNVALYDDRGELRRGWPQHFGGAHEVRAVAGGDVDGDGVVEILVNKTSDGPATAVYELDGSMHPNWPQVSASCNPPPPAEACWDFGGYNQNIGAGDVDGDGVLDVISTYDTIGFGVFHGDGRPFPTAPGFADRVITAVEAYNDPALAMQGFGSGDRSEFTDSPPVIADVDGDGDLEYVLAGTHRRAGSDEVFGNTIWVLNHDLTRPAGWERPKDTAAPIFFGDIGNNIVHTMPSPAVADLDGQRGLEIVVPCFDGVMHAYRANGEEYWRYTFATTPMPYTGASEPAIVDLNGDGVPEVVFTTYSSGRPGAPDVPAHLIVLDAAGHEVARVMLPGRGAMSAPSVADLDGDGALEIVVSLKDALGGGMGGVQIYTVPGSSTNCVLWGTGRGGLLRQGYLPRPRS